MKWVGIVVGTLVWLGLVAAAPGLVLTLSFVGVLIWLVGRHRSGGGSAAIMPADPMTPLPSIATPRLLARPGETVHFEAPVDLMKDVVQRERRGGYSGVSLHVARGMTYHVGRTRSHTVVTGHKLEVQDHGSLVLTSRRAVFVGLRTSLEIPLDRLLNVTVYKDGIQFHVSGRQAAPILRLRGRPLEHALYVLDRTLQSLAAPTA